MERPSAFRGAVVRGVLSNGLPSEQIVVTRADVTLRRWLRSSVVISKDHVDHVKQQRIRVLLGHRVFVTFRDRDGAPFVPQGFIPWRADALLESLTRNGWRGSRHATPDQTN